MTKGAVEITVLPERGLDVILSCDALDFIADLQSRFGERRLELLAARSRRLPPAGFLEASRHVRDEEWVVAAPRSDYADRRVEITGPADRKMMINALNSGACGFMADLEDATSPTFGNVLRAQRNLIDAVDRTLAYDAPDGRRYELADQVATLLVRPRGWHLPEKHIRMAGAPVPGALVDFGLYAFHCAPRLNALGRGIYFYLAKLEHHLEARLWRDIFVFTEDALGLSRGAIRATVLIETVPAAFQMHEILYELREHSYGLNAGRWDYIFSMIKTFRDESQFLLPNRSDVTMTAPFMSAYTELLVKTCHQRGTFAIGGMAALLPSRSDPERTRRAVAAVRADKAREAKAGFDGTWVAHPDLVAVARKEFDAVLGGEKHQIQMQREDVDVQPDQLLDVATTAGQITEAGVRGNLRVALQYIACWLKGRGAVAIDNMMEDAATAEIARMQLWQWIRHGAQLDDGRTITRGLVQSLLAFEIARTRSETDGTPQDAAAISAAGSIVEQLTISEEPVEFFTLPAYELLD